MHWYSQPNLFPAATLDLGLEEKARRIQAHTPAELLPVFDKLEDWMRILGYPNKDLFAVALALHEAATNAFQHGNGNDPAKHVQVAYLVSPEEVLVEVRDEGRGFYPDAVPGALTGKQDRPRRRGLFLMRAYMSWVSFNLRGNSVTLCRQRST